jgi:hypothetical protein
MSAETFLQKNATQSVHDNKPTYFAEAGPEPRFEEV